MPFDSDLLDTTSAHYQDVMNEITSSIIQQFKEEEFTRLDYCFSVEHSIYLTGKVKYDHFPPHFSPVKTQPCQTRDRL